MTRFLGKSSIKSMLNKGKMHSLRVSGDVLKTLCKIFAAWDGLMAASWARLFLYFIVLIGRRIKMIFPLS